MAINLREVVAAKIWDCVPSMCDVTWAEAKQASDSTMRECVATYYRFADAALTTIEPTLRRALEALEAMRLDTYYDNSSLKSQGMCINAIVELKQLLGGDDGKGEA